MIMFWLDHSESWDALAILTMTLSFKFAACCHWPGCPGCWPLIGQDAPVLAFDWLSVPALPWPEESCCLPPTRQNKIREKKSPGCSYQVLSNSDSGAVRQSGDIIHCQVLVLFQYIYHLCYPINPDSLKVISNWKYSRKVFTVFTLWCSKFLLWNLK